MPEDAGEYIKLVTLNVSEKTYWITLRDYMKRIGVNVSRGYMRRILDKEYNLTGKGEVVVEFSRPITGKAVDAVAGLFANGETDIVSLAAVQGEEYEFPCIRASVKFCEAVLSWHAGHSRYFD